MFSFVSLVHVDQSCLASYALEVARVLQPGGSAFLHHSNLGEDVVDGELRMANPFRRDATVSAETAAAAFRHAGLVSVAHEKVQWTGGAPATDAYCDCFSLVTKPFVPNSAPPDSRTTFYNDRFIVEIADSRHIAARYRSPARSPESGRSPSSHSHH